MYQSNQPNQFDRKLEYRTGDAPLFTEKLKITANDHHTVIKHRTKTNI
jgi:hypothetical protein